jgi:hypothetical protein
MRVPSLLLAALAVTLSQVPIHAQGSAFDQIVAADGLRYQGEPKAAVAILESMVQTQASGMLESDLGSRLRREASSALANLESRQCRGCTIDANGFR